MTQYTQELLRQYRKECSYPIEIDEPPPVRISRTNQISIILAMLKEVELMCPNVLQLVQEIVAEEMEIEQKRGKTKQNYI